MCSCGSSSQMVCKATFNSSIVYRLLLEFVVLFQHGTLDVIVQWVAIWKFVGHWLFSMNPLQFACSRSCVTCVVWARAHRFAGRWIHSLTVCVAANGGHFEHMQQGSISNSLSSSQHQKSVFTARRSYASAILMIIILSVLLIVTRGLCDETKADISTLHERTIALVLWHQQKLVDNVPFHLQFALNDPHPFWKTPTSTNICLYLNLKRWRKYTIIANRKSTTRFPMSYRWSAYVTSNSPKRWRKKRLSFFCIQFKFNRIKSATKFLCVKTSSSKIVAEPFPYVTVYICWRQT